MAFAPYACGEGLLLSKVCFVPCSSSRKQTPFLFIQGVGNTHLLNFLCLQLYILTNLDLGSDCAWIPRPFLTLIRMQSLTGRASSIDRHSSSPSSQVTRTRAHSRTHAHPGPQDGSLSRGLTFPAELVTGSQVGFEQLLTYFLPCDCRWS